MAQTITIENVSDQIVPIITRTSTNASTINIPPKKRIELSELDVDTAQLEQLKNKMLIKTSIS